MLQSANTSLACLSTYW